MKGKRIIITICAVLLAVTVSAQPPRIREEARRMTNGVDRRVGLRGGQYDRIYRINLRYASGDISRDRRDREYRRVLSDHQWGRYVGRPGPGPRYHRHGPPPPRREGPRHHRRHHYRY